MEHSAEAELWIRLCAVFLKPLSGFACPVVHCVQRAKRRRSSFFTRRTQAPLIPGSEHIITGYRHISQVPFSVYSSLWS